MNEDDKRQGGEEHAAMLGRRQKRRNRIETIIGRLKGWRRVARGYDRCTETFFSAIATAPSDLFWL